MAAYDQRGQTVGVQQNADQIVNVFAAPASPLSRHDLDNRRRMLHRIGSEVEQRLKTSLYGAAWMRLGYEERPDAVPGHRSQEADEHGVNASIGLTTGSIVDVFDAHDGELLILGAPGAGKTTTLLSLARELIARAVDDVTLPIPLIFNLSTWGRVSGSLDDWLVRELVVAYDMSTDIARDWIRNDDVLPLLDGLDEVADERRPACVEAINSFRARHTKRLNRMAICSRVAAYEGLPQLRLRGAILVQSLTPNQVDSYLADMGDRVAGLRAALRDDAVLLEMATTPLLLNIMTLTYQGSHQMSLPTAHSAEDRRAQLLTAYVIRMFRRRRPDARFPADRTVQWLAWLARALDRRSQVTFYLEHLQPGWLPTARERLWYALVDRLGWAMIFGLSFGVSIGLIHWWIYGPLYGLPISIGAAAATGLGCAVSAGLFGGKRERRASVRRSQFRRDLTNIGNIGKGMLVGIAIVLLFVLIHYLTPGALGWNFILLVLLGTVPQMGVLSALTGGPGIRPRWIVPVDNVGWSPVTAARAGAVGFGFGTVAGLGIVAAYAASREPDAVISQLLTSGLWLGGLVLGPIVGISFGVMAGFTRGQVVLRATPNQGIRRSVRRSFLLGLVALVLTAASMIFVFPPLDETRGTLAAIINLALRVGLACGLPLALAHGGYTGLSHGALRLILWRQGAIPLKYVDFLDYAAECIFMRRVGGGYVFIHRLVQEHFARHEQELLALVRALPGEPEQVNRGLQTGSS